MMNFNISSDAQRIAYTRQISEHLITDATADSNQTRRLAPIRPKVARVLPKRRRVGAESNAFFRSAPHYSRLDSDTLLLEALRERRLDQLQRLLHTKGLYTPVENRCTIADLAVNRRDEEVLQLLANMHYDFNRRNADGFVPMHYAVKIGSLSIILLLHQLGASPNVAYPMHSPLADTTTTNAANDKKYSEFPLHVACGQHTVKVLELLLNECQADVKVQDWQGNTALHRACLEDSLPHVSYLLPFCDAEMLNERGFEGKTALHIAVLNQNRRLMELLLQRGALVDVPADNGKTAIDLLMDLNNPILLQNFVRFSTIRASDGVLAQDLMDLSHEPIFLQFLEFLSRIDNEFQTCRVDYKDLSDRETDQLCSRLEFDNRIDLVEFKEVILQLVQTEAIHSLARPEASETLRKVVENVVHYVMFREDAALLERIMLCGELWTQMSQVIESSLDALYLQAPEREVNGIVQHFRTYFIEDDRVRHDLVCNYYGQLCGCYNLPPYRPQRMSADSLFMRHPLDTLPVWSVLCGRLSLTALLLRQEKFDVVPIALFCAALLRTFRKNPELLIDPEEIDELALTCERFARKAIERLYAIDTSYKRSVTIDFLLQPLVSFGGVSCAQLAAANKCAHFLQSESCQLALDKKWFGSLLYTNVVLRECLIWMGALPFNFLMPLVLVCFDEHELKARRRHERLSIDPGKSSNVSEKFRLTLIRSSLPSSDSLGSMKQQKKANEQKPLPKLPTSNRRRHLIFGNSAYENDKNRQSLIEASTNEDCVSSVNSSTATRAKRRIRRFFELLFAFYTVPAVKFHYHVASHCLLVALLSYCLLIDFTYKISLVEIVAYAILFGMALEEVGEVVQYNLHNNIRAYLRSKWNIIDVTALSCGIIGFIIRIAEMLEMGDSTSWTGMERDFLDKPWYVARLFLSICCTLYWVRLLYVSTVLETLGPKLNMIARMITKDLLPFLLILFIFIFGFGVLMHSLLYPNGYRAWNPRQLNKVHVILGMLKICFYSMVGEYSLDSILGDEQCEDIYSNSTTNEANCPHHFGRYLVPYIVLPLYVIVTEILLLNLIIAMFSKTIDKIDSRSKGVWQFERHNLVEEFQSRSALPPPLNVLDLARKLFKLIANRCIRQCAGSGSLDGGQFHLGTVLQFLVLQSLALRNRREELMHQSLPKQETEADSLLTRVRSIVEEEVAKIMTMHNEDYDTGESFIRGSLFEASPSSIRRGAASLVEASAEHSPVASGGRSIDSVATNRSRNVILRDLN